MQHTDALATGFIMGFAKIIPLILFAVAGYFVFLKLPFYIFLKVLRDAKGGSKFQMQEVKWEGNEFKPEYSVDNYEAFLRRRRRAQEAEEQARQSTENVLKFERFDRDETPREETAQQKKERSEMNERRKKYNEELKTKAEEQQRRRAQEKEKQRQEQKAKEHREKEARQEREQHERQQRHESRREATGLISPEKIFAMEPGQKMTPDELKRRYRDLLKTNHPDKVATEGTSVRQMADKKTKEINAAYDKLKNKAA